MALCEKKLNTPDSTTSMSRPNRLPDFYILGATKCGTTSLHYYLRQHPDLFLPYVKEIRFFDEDEDAFRSGLENYLTYFEGREDEITGEASPSYFRRTDVVPHRIGTLYVDRSPKFIILLRDPVERAYSNYLHNFRRGSEELSFKEALEAEQANPSERWWNWKGYFEDGLYANRLSQWFDRFSEERFLILLTEDLKNSPSDELRKTFRFLDVDPDIKIDTTAQLNRAGRERSEALKSLLTDPPSWVHSVVKKILPEPTRRSIKQYLRHANVQSYEERPTLDREVACDLRDRYRPHVQKLSGMIDHDLSNWMADNRAETELN
jgi:hypothetical protein